MNIELVVWYNDPIKADICEAIGKHHEKKGAERVMRMFWKVTLVTVSFSACLILFFSVYLYNRARNDLIIEFQNASSGQLRQLEKTIEMMFEHFQSDLDLLVSFDAFHQIHPDMHSMLSENLPEMGVPQYSDPLDRMILDIFKHYDRSHVHVTMIALGTRYGGYIEFPVVALGKGYDPRLRPWYIQAQQAHGKTVFTDPYVTLFSNKPQIACTRSIIGEHGEVLGVISLNITLEALSEMVEQTAIFHGGRILIEDSRGRILTDSQDNLNIFQPLSEVIPALKTPFEEQPSFIMIDREQYLATHIDSTMLGFHLHLIAPQSEVFRRLSASTRDLVYLAVLVFGVVILIITFISKTIANPIENLSRSMIRFAKGEYATRSPLKGSKEVQTISKSFNMMADTLEASIKEKEALNDELNTANRSLKKTNIDLVDSHQSVQAFSNNMEELISITSRICASAISRDHYFLKDLLEMMLSLVKKADYGSVSIVEGDYWKFIWAIGHDMSILKDLQLKKNDLLINKDGACILNIMAHNKDILEDQTMIKLQQATRPIKSSIVSGLTFHQNILGSIALDIAETSNESFNENDVKIVNAFSNIASAFITMQRYMLEQEQFQKDLLTALINLLEVHDPYTKGHSMNVANYSVKIAKALALSNDDLGRIFWAGMVHDIGKILVPATVLVKPTPLTEDEYDLIQNHPSWGGNVLSTFDALQDVSAFVRYHHERWDGRGYPEGIDKKAIPLEARIISVADAFDAMTSERPYRKPFSTEQAFKEVVRCSGSQFDPEVVKAFAQVFASLFAEEA